MSLIYKNIQECTVVKYTRIRLSTHEVSKNIQKYTRIRLSIHEVYKNIQELD